MADESNSKILEELKEELKLIKEQNVEIKNRAEQDKEILTIKQIQREYLEDEEKLQKRIKDLKKIIAQKGKEASDAERELLFTLQEQAEIIKKAGESAKDLANSFSTIFSGKAPDLKGALDPKNLMSVAEKMKDIKAGGMAATKLFAGVFAVGSVLAFTKAIVDLAIDLGDAEANFMKVTGANQDFARSVTNSYKETRKFGASIEETSKAYEALYTGFTDFTFMAKEQRESLAQTSAVLNKLGISNTDFAKSVQISTKALGMSAEQAGQNMLNMEKFAEEIGVAPQMLGQQFAGAGEMMAKMGDQGVDAFKDLAIASKITGLEMEKILRITDKFDTFEGAAEQAGKLNAALGGNFVNAMDLMMATDPAERFNMIRDSLLNAGLSFDDMSYYQKKFYADSLGLSDVSELALVMSGNMDMLSESTKQTEQSYVDAAKRANEMQGFQEKLNTAFAQMIPILTPLIDLFTILTTFMLEYAEVFKFIGAILIPVFIAGIVALNWSMITLAASTLAATWPFLAAAAAIGAIGYLLFKKSYASSFLEGLGKIGNAFGFIAEMVLSVMNPMNLVSGAIDSVGGKIKGFMGLGEDANTMKEISIKKNVQVANSATAATAAGTPAATSGREQTVRQPIQITLNGDKMAEFVVEVIGREIRTVRAGG